jgi:Zn-dependent protease
VARGRGREATRIVFHGFLAETIVAERLRAPRHEALVALVGPLTNLALAGLIETSRLALATDGPLDVGLLLLVLGNLAMAVMSLLPVGASDGQRALRALRRARSSGCQ